MMSKLSFSFFTVGWSVGIGLSRGGGTGMV